MDYSVKVSCYSLQIVIYFVCVPIGASFVMLAYLSTTLQCVEAPCNDVWHKIVFAVTTIRSLRKVFVNLHYLLFMNCLLLLYRSGNILKMPL